MISYIRFVCYSDVDLISFDRLTTGQKTFDRFYFILLLYSPSWLQ